MPLFVLVMTSSLVHAQYLTITLETRAFGAILDRTFLREVPFKRVDWIVCLALVALSVASCMAAWQFGLGVLPFTPQRGC